MVRRRGLYNVVRVAGESEPTDCGLRSQDERRHRPGWSSRGSSARSHRGHWRTPTRIVLQNNNSKWWVYDGGAGPTPSWSVADDLATFINLHDTATPHSQFDGGQAKALPSGVAKGDPVFYILSDSDTTYGHASILVGPGTDPTSKWVGGLVDQHTYDRYHAILNLIPYNSQWATTSTEEFHMSTAA